MLYKQKRGYGLEDDEFPTFVPGDFGCTMRATDIGQKKHSLNNGQPFGTEGFFPPEASATKNKHAGRWGRPTDLWQVGALLVCMCRFRNIPQPYMLASPNPYGDGYRPDVNRVVKITWQMGALNVSMCCLHDIPDPNKLERGILAMNLESATTRVAARPTVNNPTLTKFCFDMTGRTRAGFQLTP